jgi:protein-disulfide isomerase
VKIVYKNFMVHPDQVKAAHMAGCAAQAQGKFADFYHAFWEKAYGAYAKTRDPSKLGEENILAIAKEIGLDIEQLKTAMASKECAERIAADMAELSKFGVNGTPSFFINGRYTMFSGPMEFKRLIDEELKIAEGSGVPGEQYYQQEVMGKGLKKFRSMKDAREEAEGKAAVKVPESAEAAGK